MKNRKSVVTSACVIGMCGLLQTQAVSVEKPFTGSSEFLAAPACGMAYLRISSDDIVINRCFDSCESVTFSTVDETDQPLADGLYHYELTMLSHAIVDDQAALRTALDESDKLAVEELTKRLHSGNYAVTRDTGMFRASSGVVSKYTETVYEAEAQAEMIADQEAGAGQKLHFR